MILNSTEAKLSVTPIAGIYRWLYFLRIKFAMIYLRPKDVEC